ncbi:MAG: DUF2304 domain-containing protein [Lachnospiraceae bacterium]|nr:DUF2304 domain-containing protein [Lachnospiraceae bacterium]
MLNVRTQIIIAILVALGFIYIITLIRHKKLEIRLSLIWFLAGSVILLFDLFPSLMTELSGVLGIYAPVNMLFFFGFLFSMIIIFYLTVTVSRQSLQIRNLTQELAIIKAALDEKRGNVKKDDGNRDGDRGDADQRDDDPIEATDPSYSRKEKSRG